MVPCKDADFKEILDAFGPLDSCLQTAQSAASLIICADHSQILEVDSKSHSRILEVDSKYPKVARLDWFF